MPIVGTGAVLGRARKIAKDGVLKKWRAVGATRVLTPDDFEAMHEEIEEADSNAILAHIAAFATVIGTATGVTTGSAAVPVAGTVK